MKEDVNNNLVFDPSLYSEEQIIEEIKKSIKQIESGDFDIVESFDE
jgi:hypothetical protein